MNIHPQFKYASVEEWKREALGIVEAPKRDWLILSGPGFFVAQVAKETGVSVERIMSKSVRPRDRRARKLAIQRVREALPDMTLTAISKFFDVHRTTVADHIGLRVKRPVRRGGEKS
jgi:hypothetical protein